MANTVYDNFYLSNEVEDLFKSHLDLFPFCQVDDTLEGTAGMKRVINVYTATEGTEKLAVTQGNTKSIEVGFTKKEYEIALAQNRFVYYDEQAMRDPNLVPVGLQQMATDMFNTVNKDIFAEFNKTTQTVAGSGKVFNDFIDAVATLNVDGTDNDPAKLSLFGFVSPKTMAIVRKGLADQLKYVESFVRTGYVGTVGGVHLFVKKDAKDGDVVIATPKAITVFVKKGTEVEPKRDPNTRENSIFSRKYYIAALTNKTQAVKITGLKLPTATGV